jgi:hypothetical protein
MTKNETKFISIELKNLRRKMSNFVMFKNQLYIPLIVVCLVDFFYFIYLFIGLFCIRVPKVTVLALMIMLQMEHILLEMLVLSKLMWHQIQDLHYLQRLIDVVMRSLLL